VHLLTEVEGLSLRTVQYCVFDEADRLFEMGFADQIRAVRRPAPGQRAPPGRRALRRSGRSCINRPLCMRGWLEWRAVAELLRVALRIAETFRESLPGEPSGLCWS